LTLFRNSDFPEILCEKRDDFAALTALLRVLVLRGVPPPALVELLSPEPARMVQEGARLRARLPAYLVRRRALLDAHCPVLLPPLQALVLGYMELTTTEEIWATGLGADERPRVDDPDLNAQLHLLPYMYAPHLRSPQCRMSCCCNNVTL
jgi:hypothetical protein